VVAAEWQFLVRVSGYVGCYVTVLGWRVRVWGLSNGFACDSFRLDAWDSGAAKWQLGYRLRICGRLCGSVKLEAEDMVLLCNSFRLDA
jgi:hypothetical protein